MCIIVHNSAVGQRVGTVRMATYNVKLLPQALKFGAHRPVKRARIIPELMAMDSLEVIVFQEVFNRTAARVLMKRLQPWFPYQVGPDAYRKMGWKWGSGVLIVSKFPLERLSKIRFSDCDGWDCMGKKGGMLVRVKAPVPFQVLGTHIQSGRNTAVKLRQLQELRAMLDAAKQPGEAQWVLGDFNISNTDTMMYAALLRILDAEDGPISGSLRYTSDHLLSDLYRYDPKKRRVVDYVLCRRNGAAMEVVKRTVRMYCKRWSARHYDLSDHFALRCEAAFFLE
ncbi:MAG: sphingomyelin phosphodiesterase [Chitinophagales bacterium]